MERFRFDNAYGKVFEFDKSQDAYVFVGTYIAFGINSKMSDDQKKEIVTESLLYSDD